MGLKDMFRFKKRNLAQENELKAELDQLEEFRKSEKSETQDTALHVACQHHYSDDLIIDVLIKENQNALSVENSVGELPLHAAMKNVDERDGHKGVSEKVLDTMISLNKEGVEHLDSNDCAPLHVACEHNADDDTVKKLLQAYPDAAMLHCSITKPFDKSSIVSTETDDLSSSGTGNLSCCGDVGSILPSTATKKNEMKDTEEFETDFSPLHLSIINKASPNVVDYIINANPSCLNLETSKGRKAVDIARSMTEPSADVLHVIETYTKNAEKVSNLEARSSSIIKEASKRIVVSSEETFDPKSHWKATINAVIFANRLASTLGPSSALDKNDVKIPDDFVPPASLEHNCVDVKLPIGFRQLRWALLNSKSDFNREFHENEMGYSEFEMKSWDNCDNEIGQAESNENDKMFINATREMNYLMPKSVLVPANMAYTTETIIEYSDYCIAIKRVAKNPDVPFGKTFEAHCLDVFLNTGSDTTQMITSAEAKFYGRPPFIAWKIRTAMYDGITSKTLALGSAICDVKSQEMNL